MKSFLFSRVMRPDTFFMWCSRVPSPLPPASVFQTVALFLLDLVVSLFEPPVKAPLVVFLLLFASLFISSSLPGWLFPSLLLLSLFFCFCLLTQSDAADNKKQFTKTVGNTLVLLLRPPICSSDCGCCGTWVVVMVDKTWSLNGPLLTFYWNEWTL